MRLWALLLCAACARPIAAVSRVPNPLVARDEANYEVTIDLRDLSSPSGLVNASPHAGLRPSRDPSLPLWLEANRFRQSARLLLGGGDEVRVDVRLTSEWRELATLREYDIELRDDHGQRAVPETFARTETSRDYETTYMVWRNFQTVRIREDDGSQRIFGIWGPDPAYHLQRIWRGGGTLVFPTGTLRPDTRSLTLTLRSRARTLAFTWEFDGKMVARTP